MNIDLQIIRVRLDDPFHSFYNLFYFQNRRFCVWPKSFLPICFSPFSKCNIFPNLFTIYLSPWPLSSKTISPLFHHGHLMFLSLICDFALICDLATIPGHGCPLLVTSSPSFPSCFVDLTIGVSNPSKVILVQKSGFVSLLSTISGAFGSRLYGLTVGLVDWLFLFSDLTISCLFDVLEGLFIW